MYETTLTVHSILRLAVLLLVGAAFLRAAHGTATGRPWGSGDRVSALVATIVVDLQLVIGLVLHLALSPVTKNAFSNMGVAMKDPEMRRWTVEHPTLMLVAVVVLLLSKAKFLLLGLSKLPTLISAFGFFGLYWAAFGWPLALGLVLGIYVHEMGHVAALVRLGIRPSAPMFIPGFGAFVSYSKRITDPREDAIVGLAGPIWGAGFGLVAFALAEWYGNATLLAVAQLTGWLNLFNLLPFFGLDGSHGFPPLSRPQQVVVVAAMVLGAWLTAVPILWLVAIAGGVRLFVGGAGTGDARTLANFLGLLAVLAWMAQLKAL